MSLKGKTIAVSDLNAPGKNFFSVLLKKNGIDPDGEFYGRVGAAAKFNANWGVSGEVKLAKGGDREWFVGPRFTW